MRGLGWWRKYGRRRATSTCSSGPGMRAGGGRKPLEGKLRCEPVTGEAGPGFLPEQGLVRNQSQGCLRSVFSWWPDSLARLEETATELITPI